MEHTANLVQICLRFVDHMEDSVGGHGATQPSGIAGDASDRSSSTDTATRVTYTVAMVDGSEVDLALTTEATVSDAYEVLAAQRGLPKYRFKLFVKGSDVTLPVASKEKLVEIAQGERDMFAVMSHGAILGEGFGLEDCDQLEDVTFEHHSPLAFGMSEVCDKTCKGIRLSRGSGPMHAVVFKGMPFEPREMGVVGPPLSGRILIRAVLHRRAYALGIGVGTAELAFNKDPEHDDAFFGLYHGGASTNVCARADRIYEHGPAWPPDAKLAILIDTDKRTMQCYLDTEEFGPLYTDLPEDALWPVLVLWRDSDSVSIAISSV